MKWTIYLLVACAFAGDGPTAAKPAAEAITDVEAAAFSALVQEQRVNAAELRAATAEQGRLNEVAMRLITKACGDRGITASDFRSLTEICDVNPERRTVTKRQAPSEKPLAK